MMFVHIGQQLGRRVCHKSSALSVLCRQGLNYRAEPCTVRFSGSRSGDHHAAQPLSTPGPDSKDQLPASYERVRDAYIALDYVAKRKDVQASNIGMVGFSHGAMAVLNSDDANFPDVDPARLTSARYNGAIAFYPGCAEVVRREPAFRARTPLLILVGEKDDWTFPEHCQRLAARAAKAGQPVSIVSYPGAYHAFDMTSPARLRTDVKRGRNPDGVHVGGDPVARDDAYRRVDAFFQERFSNGR